MLVAVPRFFSDVPALPRETEMSSSKVRMLRHGLAVIARHGYAGSSIRILARELGLQPSALYAHFPSKEHVLAALIQLGHESYLESLQTALLGCGADPVEQLRTFVRAHVRFHIEYAMLAVVVNEEMHALSVELAAPSLALRRRATAILAEIVKRGEDQGRFRALHLVTTALAIGGMGNRIANWYRDDFDLTPGQIADVHAELALRMVGAEGAAPRDAS